MFYNNKQRKELGLTPSEYIVFIKLYQCSEIKRKITQTEIRDETGVSCPTISKTINKLKKWISYENNIPTVKKQFFEDVYNKRPC